MCGAVAIQVVGRTEVDHECLLELDSVSVSEVLGLSGFRIMSLKNYRTRWTASVYWSWIVYL